MFDYDKAKEISRKLNHFCWFVKEYMDLINTDICTVEEERLAVVMNHIAKLSGDLQYEFCKNELDNYD